MNRAIDLDTIAPDDIDTLESQSPTPTPVSTPKNKVVKKTKKVHTVIKSSQAHGGPKKVDEILNSARGDSYSFLVKPKSFKFEDCNDCEEILLVLRPHWFSNVRWVIISFLLFFIPTLLNFVFSSSNSIFKADVFPGNYRFMATIFWFVFVFIFMFESFLSWYFDVYIVTDRRVIDIHFNNLLDKKSSEAGIEAIQDVTSHIAGLSQTIFNYGDIKIQTAGTISEITFNKVPNPGRVADVIQELREEINKQKEEGGNQ